MSAARQRLAAHELGDARPHEHAAADVADDRIAAIERAGVRLAHPGDGGKDRGADLGRSHIAREHAVALREHAARGDALDELGDRRAIEHASRPGAVAGVVRELHGVDRPHLDAEPLHREHGGGVADMAIGDVRLDREDVHGRRG